MNLRHLIREALAFQQELTDREWIGCLNSVTRIMARSSRTRPNQPVTFSPAPYPLQGYGYGAVVQGVREAVQHPQHLRAVLGHCAASGWVVVEVVPVWWRHLLGEGSSYEVTVPVTE